MEKVAVAGSEALQERVPMKNELDGLFNLLAFIIPQCALSVCLAKADLLEPLKRLVLKKFKGVLAEYVEILLFCPMCLGFWVGALTSIANIYPFSISRFSMLLQCPFLVAVGSAILDRLAFREKK